MAAALLDVSGVFLMTTCDDTSSGTEGARTEQDVQPAYRRDVMRRTCRVAVASLAGCVLTAAAGVVLVAPGVARAASAVPVPGSAPAVGAGALVGAVPASQQLTVQVWLAPDLAGAAAFADAVATPGSSAFHHYLSPDAYTARFGPSAAHAAAVTAWLTAQGLAQVHAGSGRDYVSATGPVSRIQPAFGVRIDRYRVMGADGEPTVIESNNRAVSVPASLAPDVLGVTGLDSAPPVTSPAARTPGRAGSAAATPACSHYWAQYTRSFRPAYRGLAKGSLPVCGYSAGQIRAAYGATAAATGQGQTVAMTESEAPTAMRATLKDYAKANHLPTPKPRQFRELQTASGGTCGASSPGAAQAGSYSDEAEMDSEAVYAMAPGAAQLMVVGAGCNEDQALLDAALAVLTGNGARPWASIVSNSWQIPVGEVPAQTVHAIDLRAAAEGVGMYFASGDTPGLTVTDSDPYATAIGGTTLGIGAGNHRVFETGWSDDYATLDAGRWTDTGIGGGTGGGTSGVWGQPAYQKGVVPASMSRVRAGKRIVTGRAVPDIAADGDPDSGILTGYIASGTDAHPGRYHTEVNAGTSLATPLVAGLVADAQQGQKSDFGFIDPLIYRLAGTRAFHDIAPVNASMPQQDRDAWEAASAGASPAVDVFDSQKRAYTQQVTAKGYDTMTGVGTPNGAAFITALRRAAGCSR
jgi:subtilase family serine protease